MRVAIAILPDQRGHMTAGMALQAALAADGHEARVLVYPDELQERARRLRDGRLSVLVEWPALQVALTHETLRMRREMGADLVVVDRHMPIVFWALHGLRVPLRVFSTTLPWEPTPLGLETWIAAPPELAPAPPRRGEHYIGPTLGPKGFGGAATSWHRHLGPRVFAAFGSAPNPGLRRVVGMLIAAARGQPWALWVAWPRGLGRFEIEPLPENVTVTAGAQQRDALDRADLFVTHGGLNSAKESLAAGVPMVAAPGTDEQRRNMRTLKRRGAARYITDAGGIKRAMEDAQSGRFAVSPWLRSALNRKTEVPDLTL